MADLPTDPRWPRAAEWIAAGTARWDGTGTPDVGLVGVGTHRTSISTTNAHRTPEAVRGALARYSTWSESHAVELQDLWAVDLGDVVEPDGPEGEERTANLVGAWPGRLLIALGGDNSLTFPVAVGSAAGGLVTLDAHHDLRDGISNGSPVRRLLAAGMPGSHIVQIGLADFANSREYASRARDAGITLITREQVADLGIRAVMQRGLAIASAGGERVHVDLDVDVCDRSVVPACPAAAPGGLSAWELRQAAYLAGAHPSVVSIDLAEVDATADSGDQRTVRLVALAVLEAAAGLAGREA